MARARRVELSAIIGQLPNIQKFNPSIGSSHGPDDLFLCALGFEPRCLTLPKLLAESGYRSDRVVFFEYDTNVEQNEVNRQELTKHLGTISDNVLPLALSDPEYPNEFRHILAQISEAAPGGRGRITFDLSVAANRIVVTSMAVLCEAEAELSVLYSEAATYHPTKTEYDAEPSVWREESELGLERGVGGVRPSREFPGQHFDQFA